jgi:hypothetical protein
MFMRMKPKTPLFLPCSADGICRKWAESYDLATVLQISPVKVPVIGSQALVTLGFSDGLM